MRDHNLCEGEAGHSRKIHARTYRGTGPYRIESERRPKPLRSCYRAGMTEGTSYCFECKRPLVEIDSRGHHLLGCMTCRSVTGGGAVKLSEEDLAALHAMRRTK